MAKSFVCYGFLVALTHMQTLQMTQMSKCVIRNRRLIAPIHAQEV